MGRVMFTVDIKPEFNASYGPTTWTYTYKPSNINYIMRHGADGPSTIGFDIPMDDPFLTRNQFGPWRSEFRFKKDDQIIMQGLITKVNPIPNDRVQVGGA